MTQLSHRLRRIGLAVVVGVGLAAAAAAQPTLQDRLDRLADGLVLEDGQRASLASIASQYADPDRADLWTAAAQVHDVLTPEQRAQLRQAGETRRQAQGDRPGARAARDGTRPRRGQGRGRRGATDRERGDRAQLTDDQRRAVRDVRQSVRDQREDLVGQLRDGRITDDAFVERMASLRSASKARLADALPADAAARLDERDAQRQAARRAREAALNLTAEQRERLQALRLDRLRSGEAPGVRGPDGDGRLDRRALRDALRERRERARPERQAARRAASEVLTDDQRDVVALHRALSGPLNRADRDRGRGR